jgi:hypothetical protein
MRRPGLQKEEPDKLTEAEKAVVVRLARGEEDVRAGCQAIYYANIKGHVDGGRKAVEMTFPSEVFNVCPDFSISAGPVSPVSSSAPTLTRAPRADPRSCDGC